MFRGIFGGAAGGGGRGMEEAKRGKNGPTTTSSSGSRERQTSVSGKSERSDYYDDGAGGEDEEEDYDDYNNEDDEGDEDEEEEEEEEEEESYMVPERYDGNILSSDAEKSRVLVNFKELREDGAFCDITFVCQGKRFRAHRAIVSAWSRWLRALLCEEQPSEDVVSLDVFDPLSFGKVLDYMYGVPLNVTLDTAEALLKVVHRLQLQGLEESIWIFLMKVVDPDNCEALHDLADRYDCPPLKLMAWRILQESIPGYSSVPASLLAASAAAGVLKGTGLTGPGEPEFLSNLPQTQLPAQAERRRHDLEDHDVPSIFSHFTPPPPSEAGDDDDDYLPPPPPAASAYTHPKELPPAASAQDLVKAWSARLGDVYARCNAPEGDAFLDPDTMEVQGGKKILYSGGAARHQQRNRGSPNSAGSKAGQHQRGRDKRDKPAGFVPHFRALDWRQELKGFYVGIGMPEKIPGLGEILQTWEGKEDQMLSHLIVKYKRQIPQSLAEHLNTLQGYVESQSESSFPR